MKTIAIKSKSGAMSSFRRIAMLRVTRRLTLGLLNVHHDIVSFLGNLPGRRKYSLELGHLAKSLLPECPSVLVEASRAMVELLHNLPFGPGGPVGFTSSWDAVVID